MSDYLGNLLMRTFTPGLGVRPQVPTLFEPPQGRSPITAPLESNPDGFNDTIDLPPAPVRAALLPVPQDPRSPPSPAQGGAEPGPLSRERNATEPATGGAVKPSANAPSGSGCLISTRRLAGSVSPITPVQLPSSTPSRELASVAPSETTASPMPTILEPSRERTLSPKPSAFARVIRPEPEEGATRRIPSGAGLENEGRAGEARGLPDARKLPGRAGQATVSPSLFGVIHPILPAARERARKPSTPANANSPTINVTIGRIEIRATPPPATARSKSKAASVLNLDDYLRSRAQEGRR